MNQPDTTTISGTYPVRTYHEIQAASRLIVLVPAGADHSLFLPRVGEIAYALGCEVLFLSLCNDAAQLSSVRRQMITLSAMFESGKLRAEARVELGSNWVAALRGELRDGDTVVCFAEQRVGALRQPLSEVLRSNLKMPLYILPGSYPAKPANRTSEAMTWAGSIGIIIAAFVLQMRITTLPQDWAQTTLLALSVVAEFWLINIWNSLFQ